MVGRWKSCAACVAPPQESETIRERFFRSRAARGALCDRCFGLLYSRHLHQQELAASPRPAILAAAVAAMPRSWRHDPEPARRLDVARERDARHRAAAVRGGWRVPTILFEEVDTKRTG